METKESYQEFMESVLEQWGSKIDDLEARVVKPEREKEVGYLKELDVLRTKQQEARRRLNELKSSSTDWKNLSKGVDVAVDELKTTFERVDSVVK